VKITVVVIVVKSYLKLCGFGSVTAALILSVSELTLLILADAVCAVSSVTKIVILKNYVVNVVKLDLNYVAGSVCSEGITLVIALVPPVSVGSVKAIRLGIDKRIEEQNGNCLSL
jgi:hypothetical protein